MNKLTIRNKNGSYTAFEVKVNDIDLARIANHIELVFEPCSVPILKVEIPIADVDSVIGDISGFVIGTSGNGDDPNAVIVSKESDFDRRKADILAKIEEVKHDSML